MWPLDVGTNAYRRLIVHVAAILAAATVWLLVSDFATALLLSIAVFLALSRLGHRRYGPLPGPEQLRRDIERSLSERDQNS